MTGRILVFESDKENLGPDVRRLQQQAGDEVMLFGSQGCFSNPEDVQRVTVMGHGTTKTFGEMVHGVTDTIDAMGFTPEKFVKTLIDSGLPKSVKVIDLVGCGIGQTREGQPSYAHRVAQLLFEHKEYSDVRINCISTMQSEKDMTHITIDFDIPAERYEVSGISDPQKRATFEREMLEAERKITKHYDEQIAEANRAKQKIIDEAKEAKDPNFEQRADYVACCERLHQLANECDKELSDTEVSLLRTYQDQPPFFISKDLRTSLDNQPNFQITRDTLNTYQLEKERRMAVTILNIAVGSINNDISSISAKVKNPQNYFGNEDDLERDRRKLDKLGQEKAKLVEVVQSIRTQPDKAEELISSALKGEKFVNKGAQSALERAGKCMEAHKVSQTKSAEVQAAPAPDVKKFSI